MSLDYEVIVKTKEGSIFIQYNKEEEAVDALTEIYRTLVTEDYLYLENKSIKVSWLKDSLWIVGMLVRKEDFELAYLIKR